MRNKVLKVTGITFAIYAVTFFLLGLVGGIGNLFVALYGLEFLKKKDLESVKILLLVLIIFNVAYLVWLLIWLLGLRL